ncbi:DNA N-6-adenine-methyltransferase [Microbacterium sp. RU33B]|uniref:DNA N-6-adenine-methyltransferase n=1 Tax=Microbacterium sp. RU33B TaxID=1907390 RepID=UPI000975859B|nr:DNA N-6-adenine-methyltransferase [Microbacterium sp. RU33B]
MTDRAVSPIAEIYPLMGQAELAELADSIHRNGLREPIVTRQDGTVLDGRNRLRACEIARVTPRFVEFAGTDREALEFVVDTNSHRRHLSESARALVAARLATFTHGGRRDGNAAALLTQRDAAERLGISERSVRDGKVVIDHAPEELVDDVQRGLIAVRAAAELIRAAGKDKVLVAEYHRLRRASGSTEWYTPPHVLNLVTELFGEIDLDPASNEGEPWVMARAHFTRADDGLSRGWNGRVFLNPPWDSQGSPGQWVAKLVDEYTAGRVTEAICLLPARVNTAWMDRLAPYARCFVRGRLRFGDATGDAPFPVVLVYLGARIQEFVDVFGGLGSCYRQILPSPATV